MDESVRGKFAKCIVCGCFSVKTQCFNVFNTLLEKGKIMLSVFLKNVLGCSILIIVPPDFFLCKRCYSLCADLDSTLARCSELQDAIQTLFKDARKKSQDIYESVVIKSEKQDDEENEEEYEYPEEEYEQEVQYLNEESVESIQAYLDTELKVHDNENKNNNLVSESYEPYKEKSKYYDNEVDLTDKNKAVKDVKNTFNGENVQLNEEIEAYEEEYDDYEYYEEENEEEDLRILNEKSGMFEKVGESQDEISSVSEENQVFEGGDEIEDENVVEVVTEERNEVLERESELTRKSYMTQVQNVKVREEKAHGNSEGIIYIEGSAPNPKGVLKTDALTLLEQNKISQKAAGEITATEDGVILLNEDKEDIEGYIITDLIDNEITVIETSPVRHEGGLIIRKRPRGERALESPPRVGRKRTRAIITPPDKWFCTPCDESFNSLELLTKHKKSEKCKSRVKNLGIQSVWEFKNYSIKMRRKKKIYFCNQCAFESNQPSKMEEHIQVHKNEPYIMCDVCGRRFKSGRTFRRHQLIHDESRPFPCKLCSHRAESELRLKIHEKQHDQKRYFCTKCDYKTIKKVSYLQHQRTHSGERPFCCPDCPYRAKDPSTLLRHRRIHTGIKAYQCNVCEFKALQKRTLVNHMMIHTGEKPFMCPHCDYSSTLKCNLQGHIAAKHCSEKPFACNMCSYKTKIKRLLTHHLRKHTGEKPYPCTLCDYRARYSGSLSYHMSRFHKNGETGSEPMRYRAACSFKVREDADVQLSDEDESGAESDEEVLVMGQ